MIIPELILISKLLGVVPKKLKECLTTQQITTRKYNTKETVITTLESNLSLVQEHIRLLMRWLYQSIVDWLIDKVFHIVILCLDCYIIEVT